MRAIDCLVAERVLGYRVERVTPAWYQRTGQPPREVLLFYAPTDGLLAYSWDAWGSSACMYRNGVDDSQGFVPPLPRYADDLRAAEDVLRAMTARGIGSFAIGRREHDDAWFVSLQLRHSHGAVMYTEKSLPLAICRAALAALEVATT